MLNYNDNKWWELIINFKWPHEGMGLSYDYIPPTETDRFHTFMLRLLFITFIYEWGYEEY